jgi:hypothetical protein
MPIWLASGGFTGQADRMPEPRPLKVPIWVVVRVDTPLDRYDPDHLRNRVTLVEAFPEQGEAEGEAERLNQLNAAKGSVYFSTPTRFFPSGRQVQKGY